MPSSFAASYPPIIEVLLTIAPQRVIDIGPGWGKYGLACREYLPGLQTLHAIEVPPGRLEVQDAIYDHVYTGDARLFTSPNFWARFDLVLLIDVIEHMSLAEGHRLVDLMQHSGCRVLVSTPKVFESQHDDHNPYEEHVSLWSGQDFGQHGIEADASTIDSVIYVLPGQ